MYARRFQAPDHREYRTVAAARPHANPSASVAAGVASIGALEAWGFVWASAGGSVHRAPFKPNIETNSKVGAALVPLQANGWQYPRDFAGAVAAVAFVLLIACANARI